MGIVTKKLDRAGFLKKSLAEGIVAFTFEKEDGSIREALGTMHESMLPDRFKQEREEALVLVEQASIHPDKIGGWLQLCSELRERVKEKSKSEVRKDNPKVVVYFDLEKQAFRACKVERLNADFVVWKIE